MSIFIATMLNTFAKRYQIVCRSNSGRHNTTESEKERELCFNIQNNKVYLIPSQLRYCNLAFVLDQNLREIWNGMYNQEISFGRILSSQEVVHLSRFSCQYFPSNQHWHFVIDFEMLTKVSPKRCSLFLEKKQKYPYYKSVIGLLSFTFAGYSETMLSTL